VLLLVGILGLHVSAGFIGNPGMYRFFVALPYVFVFLPLYFFTAGILRLPKEKRPFRRDEVDLSFERMKKASGGYNLEVLFLTLEVLAVGGVVFLWQYQKSISIQKISEED